MVVVPTTHPGAIHETRTSRYVFATRNEGVRPAPSRRALLEAAAAAVATPAVAGCSGFGDGQSGVRDLLVRNETAERLAVTVTVRRDADGERLLHDRRTLWPAGDEEDRDAATYAEVTDAAGEFALVVSVGEPLNWQADGAVGFRDDRCGWTAAVETSGLTLSQLCA